MTYAEKLKDPRWQRKRLEILSAANWLCISCGEPGKSLHVHHKRYLPGRDPWDYEDDDLESLCEGCHERITDIDKRLKTAVAVLGEAEKLALCGYAEAQRIFEEYNGTDMDVVVSPVNDPLFCPEWMIGFGDFFGLSEAEILSLLQEGSGDIHYHHLDAAWWVKTRRKPKE